MEWTFHTPHIPCLPLPHNSYRKSDLLLCKSISSDGNPKQATEWFIHTSVLRIVEICSNTAGSPFPPFTPPPKVESYYRNTIFERMILSALHMDDIIKRESCQNYVKSMGRNNACRLWTNERLYAMYILKTLLDSYSSQNSPPQLVKPIQADFPLTYSGENQE